MHNKKILLSYVPHAASKYYHPMTESSPDWSDYSKFKDDFKKNHDFDFAVLFNSRNIRRKNPGDIILSYKRFCDGLSKKAAKRCCLIMKTALADENGTDLLAVKRAICPDYQVVFIQDALPVQKMNWLYNLIDCTFFMSNAEGFGMAAIESMTCGKMIIAPVTGGLQDQMRFEDENGRWIDVSEEFPSNHRAKYVKCGEWAVPLFPTSRTLSGSVPTPFIFDSHVDSEDAAEAIRFVYNLPADERVRRGQLGREWALSSESGMSLTEMCSRYSRAVDKLLETWQPPSKKWELIPVGERESKESMGILWWEEQSSGQ